MKILFMLLHDFRFSDWSLETFLTRYHFAKAYSKYVGMRGHEVHLVTFHQDIVKPKTYFYKYYTLHVLPSYLFIPPYLRFGNEHSLHLPQYIKNLGKNVDIIHIHNYWLWSFPYVTLLIKHFAKNAKLIVQYHGETDPSKIIRANILRKIYNYPDLYLVARESEIAFLRKYLLKGPLGSKIIKFPNVGVNHHIFKPVAKKSDDLMVIYVGRIMHERRNKFPFILLRLSKDNLLKDVKFYIVGDGPLLNVFKKYAKKHLLRNAFLTGYLPVSDVAELMSKSWLYFYPGLLERADGYWDGAVKEALSCGTPTVALNANREQDVIIEDSMGFLLPCKSVDELVQRVWELLNKNREAIFQKSREVSEKAKFFSWDNIISKLEKIYQVLLSK
jgi:glycosyltransferase involved in cell wall biosynthesis